MPNHYDPESDFNLDDWLLDLEDDLGEGYDENLSDNIFDWTDTNQTVYDDVSQIWTMDGFLSYMGASDFNAVLAYMMEWASGDEPQYWGGGDINYSGSEQEDLFVGGQIGDLPGRFISKFLYWI